MLNSMFMLTLSGFGWKYPFGRIWSKNSKLFVQSEIWYLDYSEYAKFSGSRLETTFSLQIWSNKSKLAVWAEIWYLD